MHGGSEHQSDAVEAEHLKPEDGVCREDASQVEPDSRVDFNLHAGTDQDQANCRPSESNGKVLDSSYFEKFGAEVVCGPMELTDYVDLSGIQGTIPLTSVKLIKTKSKSFLLHFKSQKVKDKPVNKQVSIQIFLINFFL